jgi:hypothetical protein
MGKFKKNLALNNKEIVIKRGTLIEEEAISALTEIKLSVEGKIRDQKRIINNLEDLHPDTTMSLNPVKGTFDGKAWVTSLVNAKAELRELKEQLQDVLDVEQEYFTEDAE